MSAELHRIIQGASGALADAGSVVVDPIEEGIRQLTAERDELRAERDELRQAYRLVLFERDPHTKELASEWPKSQEDYDALPDALEELGKRLASPPTRPDSPANNDARGDS